MTIRPGDLAISIHTQQPQNNGLIVQVVRRHVNTAQWTMAQTSWWCTCAQPMTWKIGERTVKAHEGPVPEHCLVPIRGSGSDRPASEARQPARNNRSNRGKTEPVSPTGVHRPVHAVDVADAELV